MKNNDVCFVCRNPLKFAGVIVWTRTTMNLLHSISWHQQCDHPMACCNTGTPGNVRWNASDAQWECDHCGAVKSNDPNYLYGNAPIFYDGPKPKVVSRKCTCGSEKTFGPSGSHSSWCDLS